MASKRAMQSGKGVGALERTEATVAVLGRMWVACPPPLKTVAWTVTLVLVLPFSTVLSSSASIRSRARATFFSMRSNKHDSHRPSRVQL